MPRRLAVLVVVVTLVVASLAVPAGAGSSPPASAPTTTTLVSGNGAGHIVLRPNYGHEPTGPNDRGGWQQLLVFGLLCAGVGGVAAFAWRDSRRKRRSAAAAQPAAAQPTGPAG